jgi:hypothetical protein
MNNVVCVCFECGATFGSAEYLETHMEEHVEDKPTLTNSGYVQCNLCAAFVVNEQKPIAGHWKQHLEDPLSITREEGPQTLTANDILDIRERYLDERAEQLERASENIRREAEFALEIASDAQEGKVPVDSIAHEAWFLVHGDRQAAYGHPAADFKATGRIWGALLERWFDSLGYPEVTVSDVPPHMVALMMTAVKLSRESANPKRDNRVDGIGYWLCADCVLEDRDEL